jgi:GNAT superfamily N-acetyltransferase
MTAKFWVACWYDLGQAEVRQYSRGTGTVSQQRLGIELMSRLEQYAVERGCIDLWRSTFSFQARPFYDRFGYRLFGTLEN